MGLGKTLQALCVLIEEIKFAKRSFSMVVCPPTLVYSWKEEIEKFGISNRYLQVLTKYQQLQHAEKNKKNQENNLHKVLIISYNTVSKLTQKEIDDNFNSVYFLIADQGHYLRNPASQVSIKIKKINCVRRLVLSGTPLQNRVLDIWSIFDFLNPNLLQIDFKTFRKKFINPLKGNLKILAKKKNFKQRQGFVEAMKALQAKISPFIIRREKEDVLKQLPPREIQDFFCQMSNQQMELLEILEKKLALKDVESEYKNQPIKNSKQSKEQEKSKRNEVIGQLYLHRQLASHPQIVRGKLKIKSKNQEATLSSGKLDGLHQLLVMLGIIQQQSYIQKNQQDNIQNESLNQIIEAQPNHKAIIFFQFKQFLNIVKQRICILNKINHLTLTAELNKIQRMERVKKFNSDLDIKILLISTSVGGQGLNLTGADTVIFAEHDWNPQKDIQAMDRAHRIGQTRPVTVYRLIVRQTIQEKIMNLQEFKQHLAINLVSKTENVADKSKELTKILKM